MITSQASETGKERRSSQRTSPERRARHAEDSKLLRIRKKRISAQLESQPDQYIKLAPKFRCKTCSNLSVDCYLARTPDRPKGTAGEKCVCCLKNTCSIVTSDQVMQRILQLWLDGQPSPDNLSDPDLVTPTTIQLHSNDDQTSLDNPSINPTAASATSSASEATTSEQTPIHPNSLVTPGSVLDGSTQPAENETPSATNKIKRPRSAEMTDLPDLPNMPDKAAKTARTYDNISPPSPFLEPNHRTPKDRQIDPVGLIGYEGKDTAEQQVILTPDIEAREEIGRLEGIIKNIQVEREQLYKQFAGCRMMGGSIATKAAEQEIDAEKRFGRYKAEMETIKKQLDVTQARLDKFVDEAEWNDPMEVEIFVHSDNTTEEGWKVRMQEMESQYNAAVNNADTSRKARNEALDILATTQTEKALLQEQLATMTAKHDYYAIASPDHLAEIRRLQAEVTELSHVKAELEITLADRDRLAIELEDAKDTIEGFRIKRRIANDMLLEA